ncbi:PAS domain-containing sensor histidine kinase [Dyadobacter sp. CY347]|uniref:PAS domain-containing sensor histidine kinase n=1 Tax=Dyadobacter sp. CY347 TaxID=2909336 RepID=UPI001F4926B5|nr:PAS domain-containing sensor histidine kinase [Dyadobacter sp. CY347]MCF2489315.1 PAS domain-containing sensor histidine kinase [Dyadobacter sp. CY347]
MENSALLKAIVDHAIDGIITISDKGIIETINPSACRLFGYPENEVIGHNISMLMPTPDREQHDEYLNHYHRTAKKNIIGKGREVTGLTKYGAAFPFRLAISEVQFSGRKIYTGFIHDLSREKRAEEQLREYALHLEEQVEERTRLLTETVLALENAKEKVSRSLEKEVELGQLKSRFVSMASHEFRTPLSAIQLSSILIEKYSGECISPNIERHTAKIKHLVTHLTGILNDFLSLERLEAGEFKPVFSNFDLVKFSEEVTEDMQLMAKQNQQIIYRHTGTSAFVHLDPSLLKNAIINLISNAIKYSGEDTFIEFNTEVTPSLVTITIKDDGIGIPIDDQRHLFEAFFRAHNTGNIAGTGLGLNIVRRYVELIGGQVRFSSEVNQGTSFTLSFPTRHE